ncbi:MAG: hypothetical protein JXR91_16260, partial [Deltaproteobacteria bacterium]|nr:hypothetical protein [Deltaproteobacteria bacterium]
MKKFITSTLTILILLISLTSFAKNDGRHLELSINITPTFVMDNSIEFFSTDTKSMMAHGADIRYEVATISNVLHILPFISFRHNYST